MLFERPNFVGNDEAGQNLAGLMSLLATCDANGINPEQFAQQAEG